MAKNPDPARITGPMWRLWEDCPIPGVELGGIFAVKRGYHNTVIANMLKWSGNYSIRLPLDMVNKNRDKARAIDLTMSTTEMQQWTFRMRKSALDVNDERLNAVREFYGTLDGGTVFGLIKDSEIGEWRNATADDSHLWHGHVGIFTAFVNNWSMLSPLISVWKGETLAEWRVNMLVKKGDKGEEVKYWQYVHKMVRKATDDLGLEIDGDYGDETVAAFTRFAKDNGAPADYVANAVTGWLAKNYHVALIRAIAPKSVADPLVIKEFVDKYLKDNLPLTSMTISGTITGDIQL